MRTLTGQIYRIFLLAMMLYNLSSVTSLDFQISAETVKAGAEIRPETIVKSEKTTPKINSISLAAGLYHSLYIKNDGTLWAMGYNNNSQLGDGATDSRSTPVYIAGDVKQVAAGNVHSLFLKQDGTMWAMGYNRYGQLGDGINKTRLMPVPVAEGVSQIEAGAFHSLFIKNDGTLWAMGRNDDGQLGDGSRNNRNAPVKIATRE